jgi:hypothetical protein
MPFLQDDDITTDWSDPLTFTANEDWQVQFGSVLVYWPADALEAAPPNDDGLRFDVGSIIQFSATEVIRYRALNNRPCRINRQVRA